MQELIIPSFSGIPLSEDAFLWDCQDLGSSSNFYIISTLCNNPSLGSLWIVTECFCFGDVAINGSAKSHQQHLTQATFTPGGTHIRKGWVYSSSCLGVFGLT